METNHSISKVMIKQSNIKSKIEEAHFYEVLPTLLLTSFLPRHWGSNKLSESWENGFKSFFT